jgi:ATP-dependent Clp protease ATP-binding subunit ClpA
MKIDMSPPVRRTPKANDDSELSSALANRVIGQPNAVRSIVPYVQMHLAGLAPEGRPVGVVLLLGPTGTGKTRTVEALAEVLHGNPRHLVKVDCGEFQMEHEVAKLIGAPPGYLGHRETQPMLSQQKLNGAATERCDLSLVLFDEIEKAAPSMTRLMLGILDKAVLRLGDNTTVNFERTMIFMTSNLGADAMQKEIGASFGFGVMVGRNNSERSRRLEHIGLAAVRKRFSPEFINRMDKVVMYNPLTLENLGGILDQQLVELQRHIHRRLGSRAFVVQVSAKAKRWLLKHGVSDLYGARELRRTIHRHVIQPLALLVTSGVVTPGGRVTVEPKEDHLLLVAYPY